MKDVTVRKQIVVYANDGSMNALSHGSIESTVQLTRMLRVPDAVLGAMTEVKFPDYPDWEIVDHVVYLAPPNGRQHDYAGTIELHVMPETIRLTGAIVDSSTRADAVQQRADMIAAMYEALGWERLENDVTAHQRMAWRTTCD